MEDGAGSSDNWAARAYYQMERFYDRLDERLGETEQKVAGLMTAMEDMTKRMDRGEDSRVKVHVAIGTAVVAIVMGLLQLINRYG